MVGGSHGQVQAWPQQTHRPRGWSATCSRGSPCPQVSHPHGLTLAHRRGADCPGSSEPETWNQQRWEGVGGGGGLRGAGLSLWGVGDVPRLWGAWQAFPEKSLGPRDPRSSPLYLGR